MSSHRYLPLEAYGLVGDGRRTAALVGRDGSVDWWCLPRLEDASVFARLLHDRIGGFCSAAPAGAVHASPLWESSQRYRPRTNVLLTEFRGADAALRVADFMPPADREAGDGDGGPLLLRRLTARGGPVEAEVRFAPRFDYARRRPDFREREAGWVATGGEGSEKGGGKTLALAAGPEVSLHRDGRRREVNGRFRVEPGEPRWLALRWGRGGEVRPVRAGRCAERLERTSAFWRGRAEERAPEPAAAAGGGPPGANGPGGTTAPDGPAEEEGLAGALARSALLLDLLTVGPEGRVAAAPTTSLPGAGAPRDARRLYVPREGGVGAGGGGGEPESARGAGSAGTTSIADLGAGGGRTSEAETLDHLHGHAGGRPVVDGSDAPVRLAGELRRAGELAREGRAGEARRRVESVVSVAGPTGLLGEAADSGSGRLRGDYPWAPAHAALIGAARALAEAGRGRATSGG